MAVPPTPHRPRKPWYQSWWAITLIVLVGICTIGTITAALSDGTTPGKSGLDEAVDDANDTVDDMAEEAEEILEFGGATYFEPVTHTGSSTAVVTLPADATEGFITATHDGASNFMVSALDKNNNPTGDLLINEIGAYEGAAAYGLFELGGDATSLEVTADGAWEITVFHFEDAPVLELPAEGRGDAVFKYLGGDPASWHLTHNGESNFIVGSTSAFMSLANEIGAFDGVVPVTADPAIITIMADGDWSIIVA